MSDYYVWNKCPDLEKYCNLAVQQGGQTCYAVSVTRAFYMCQLFQGVQGAVERSVKGLKQGSLALPGCRLRACKEIDHDVVTLTNWDDVIKHLNTKGPLTGRIHVNDQLKAFLNDPNQSGNCYYGPHSPGENHAVIIVGYRWRDEGKSTQRLELFVVNSWGLYKAGRNFWIAASGVCTVVTCKEFGNDHAKTSTRAAVRDADTSDMEYEIIEEPKAFSVDGSPILECGDGGDEVLLTYGTERDGSSPDSVRYNQICTSPHVKVNMFCGDAGDEIPMIM